MPEAGTSIQREHSDPAPENFKGIELVDVRKGYRSGGRTVEAVRGVNLSIHSPGLYAVMGPSWKWQEFSAASHGRP